jgi:hypothetical protein
VSECARANEREWEQVNDTNPRGAAVNRGDSSRLMEQQEDGEGGFGESRRGSEG